MKNLAEDIERLVVKNFGPLKNVEIDLAKYTILIGPQGSGKSTISKLIAIFRDPSFALEDINHIDFFENYNIKNYFIENESNKELNTILEYKSYNYDIVYSNGKFSIETSSFFKAILNKELEVKSKLMRSLGIKDVFNLGPLKPGFTNLFSDVVIHPIYIPAERFLTSLISESLSGFISSNISLPQFIHKFNSYFENARKNINELNIKYLNILYKFENGTNKIFYEKKKFLKLSESASGFQAIVPLLLVLNSLEKDTKNNSFIIEEPELNLFPITQVELIKEISSYIWNDNNSLVVATHSPYILSSFSLLLFAYQVAIKNEKEVKKIIPERCWINPNKFVSYFISDGESKSIINKETGLIEENELDKVSLNIGDEFDKLLQIYNSNI